MNGTFPPPLQASKWLQIQALVEVQEMEQLFAQIQKSKIYLAGRLVERGELLEEEFLKVYAKYISTLKNGEIPDSAFFRPYFSSVLTFSDDCLHVMKPSKGKELIRVIKPTVQLQLHLIGYSAIEKKFRPMVLGKDSIHWGLQFSYPQICMDPLTKQIEKTSETAKFPNAPLFKAIQKWVRSNTLPTPFVVCGQRINVPMRLGKQAFGWINNHFQLRQLGIEVAAKQGASV